MLKSILYIAIFFLALSYTVNAQKQAIVTSQIDSILKIADLQIEKEQFKPAAVITDSLKTTRAYKKNIFDKLAIDLRNAQLLYEKHQNEKAVHLILNGLNKLKKHQNSKLSWDYNVYIGKILKDEKKFIKSGYYFKIALNNSITRKDTVDIIGSYYYIGFNFSEYAEIFDTVNVNYKKYNDSAINNYKKAISHRINNNTNKYISKSFNNLGVLKFENRDYQLAEEYLKKSLSIRKVFDPHDSVMFSSSTINLANLFYIRKDYIKAIQEYKKAYESIKTFNTKEAFTQREIIFQNIAWAYGELKEFDKAFEYQEKATELADSLALLNYSRDIAVIEAKFVEAQKVEIEKNKRLKTQVYLFGSAFLILILFIIGYIIYNRLINKQRKTERKISGLKYKALNAQMNPHFINNLLLCIHDLIESNEKQAAIENLDKFNKLTNLVLRSTKANLISLQDEITMLKLYLDLQLVRFEQQFEYLIDTKYLANENFERIKIPPLILQPLVENSIVHGFRNLKTTGNISIDFKLKDDDYLVCTIIDNGTVTHKELNPEMHLGNGISMQNIKARLAHIDQNKNNMELVSFKTTKNKNNIIVGAQTKLYIPLINNY